MRAGAIALLLAACSAPAAKPGDGGASPIDGGGTVCLHSPGAGEVGGATFLFPFSTALEIGAARPGTAGQGRYVGLFLPALHCAPGCELRSGDADGADRIEWLTARLPDPPVAGATLDLTAADLAAGAFVDGEAVAEELHPASYGTITITAVDADGIHGTLDASLVLLNLTAQATWSFVAGTCREGKGIETPWVTDAGPPDAGPDAGPPRDAAPADAPPPDAAPPDAGPPPDCLLTAPDTIAAAAYGGGRRAVAAAFDGAGELHLAFLDLPGKRLRHAHLGAGGWEVETIETATDDLQDTVALAADGTQLHVLYGTFAGASYQVREATGSAGSWTTAPVAAGGPEGIVVDAAGGRHAALWDDGVRYGIDTGAGWSTTPVAPGTIAASTIARSVGGELYILFAESGGALRLAAAGDGWASDLAASSVDWGVAAPLAIDGLGDPHVAYVVGGGFADTLRHAVRHGGAWAVDDPIDPSTPFVGYLSLALDDADRPHLAYADTSHVHYATQVGDVWRATTLTELGPSLQAPTIAIGPDGARHLIYFGGAGGGPALLHTVIESCWE